MNDKNITKKEKAIELLKEMDIKDSKEQGERFNTLFVHDCYSVL